MLRKLFATDKSFSGTALRVLLGVVIFPHGAQKLLGWFGGGGFNASMRMFESSFHIPTIFALLAILAESVGAVALIAGFFTRIAALAISVNMVVAVALIHAKVGFFMNWGGTAKGEGFEYHILAMAIGIVLMIMGGGRWSVDGVIAKKLKRSR
ncbi:MAG: DoxX family protein [Acidobacteria bacterium]|nr:DoxX family protein [Acidobacteriota bacterium]MBE3129111.1 DoxX family protein [Acidobacteriota bacterium]